MHNMHFSLFYELASFQNRPFPSIVFPVISADTETLESLCRAVTQRMMEKDRQSEAD